MRYFTILVLLFTTFLYFDTQAQSKKDLRNQVESLSEQVAKLTLENDSLVQIIQNQDSVLISNLHFQETLKAKLDSARFDRLKDANVNDELISTLVKRYRILDSQNIDIASLIVYIDSIESQQDSIFAAKEIFFSTQRDTILKIRNTIERLEIENNAFRDVLGLMLDDKLYPLEAKDLLGEWDVFLQPVFLINDSLGGAGVVSKNQTVLPDSLYEGMISKIVFQEEELADVYFINGTKTKAFFKVLEFSRESTYRIELSKAREYRVTLFVTHVPRGVQLSYQIPGMSYKNGYYFGYMRR